MTKVLEELPSDGEAVDLLLDIDVPNKRAMLERARDAMLAAAQRSPTETLLMGRLVHVATALEDTSLEGAAAAVAVTVGASDSVIEGALGRARSRNARAVPQWALSGELATAVRAPQDEGALANLFVLLGATLGEALGPTLVAMGVGKRDRVDARAGLQTRADVAAWAGAFGITEFELYVGGRDPLGIQGVAGEVPAIVVGPSVKSPFDALTTGRVARELFALSRGTTMFRLRDETTVAAVVVAACRVAEVPIKSPPYAVLGEVEKALRQAIARKIKKALPEVCAAVAQGGADPKAFARAALASQARIAAVATGELGIVLADMVPPANASDGRAVELAKFVLSPVYQQVRRGMGLEGQR